MDPLVSTTLSPNAIEEQMQTERMMTIIRSVASFNTGIVLILGIVHLYFVVRYVRNYNVRDNLTIIVFLYPVTSSASLLAIYLLKTAEFMFVVALTYILLNLFTLVPLMNSIFGSRAQMSRYFFSVNRRISLVAEPCCCFFRCAPTFPPSEQNLRILSFTVMQSLIIRIVMAIAGIICVLNGVDPKNVVFAILNGIATLSMILAVFGSNIIFHLVKERVELLRYIVILRLVEITQMLYTLQKFAFTIAVSAKKFDDDPLMPAAIKANFWFHFVITCEVLLFSVLATYLLRSSKSALLRTSYPISPPPEPQSDEETTEQGKLPILISSHNENNRILPLDMNTVF